MKILYKSVALIGLFLFSCTKSDVEVLLPLTPSHMVTDNVTQQLRFDPLGRVSSIVITSIYGSVKLITTQNFIYSADGKVQEMQTDTGMKFTYLYEDNLISKTEEYINDHLTQTHQFDYNAHHQVVSYITYQDIPEEGGIIPVSKSTFTYDSNGNVTENKLYYYSTSGTNETLLTTLSYSNFDTKTSTESKIQVVAVNPSLLLHQNNPGQLEVRKTNNILTSVSTFSYSYNEKGYPMTKSTDVREYNGQTSNSKTYYYYQSQ